MCFFEVLSTVMIHVFGFYSMKNHIRPGGLIQTVEFVAHGTRAFLYQVDRFSVKIPIGFLYMCVRVGSMPVARGTGNK